MSDIQQLTTIASQAIAALLLRQIELISNSTNIPVSVLCSYANIQVPVAPVAPVAIPEQVAPIPEKKKRAPPKKKVISETDAVLEEATEVAPEKKKRAPPKKKVAPEEPNNATVVAPDEPTGAIVVTPVIATEKKKKAPPKKKTTVTEEEEKKQKQVKKKEPKCEKKAISSVLCNEAVEERPLDNDDNDDTKTVIMHFSDEEKRPAKFLKSQQQINVERVIINEISYLVGENGIAYHESTKRMVGKYDSEQKTIRNLVDKEYNEYYGSSDEEDEDEDECPVLSDSEE